MNFSDFINMYRIRAIVQQIDTRKHEQQTLLAIALDNGFSSKATFNRSFKRLPGKRQQNILKQKGKGYAASSS